jgi:hypothetical protein
MDRIFLMVICSSIVLLTTAFGLASPQADGLHRNGNVPLLLRILPPPGSGPLHQPPLGQK